MKTVLQKKSSQPFPFRGKKPFFMKSGDLDSSSKNLHLVSDQSFFNHSGFDPSPGSIQPKLTIGQPGDKYEREADATADRVMRMPDPLFQRQTIETEEDEDEVTMLKRELPSLQMKCTECEKEEESLQRKPLGGSITPFFQRKEANGGGVNDRTVTSLKAGKSGGRPLSGDTRSWMGNRFGTDFSHVRVHTDSNAVQMSRELRAQAFTHGSDIYFNRGRFNPGTSDGKHLLAHELTHVLQQSNKIQRFTTEDCSDTQRESLREAFDRAKEMIGRAIGRLTASPVTSKTQQIFANHFGAYAEWRRDIVVDMHLKPMRQILNDSEMNFECEAECDGEPAYTYWVFGDVHLCPGYFSRSLNERAETTIHELFHLRGAFDLGYHGNNEDADTWWSAAINNADSFSELCQDLYEQP